MLTLPNLDICSKIRKIYRIFVPTYFAGPEPTLLIDLLMQLSPASVTPTKKVYVNSNVEWTTSS